MYSQKALPFLFRCLCMGIVKLLNENSMGKFPAEIRFFICCVDSSSVSCLPRGSFMLVLTAIILLISLSLSRSICLPISIPICDETKSFYCFCVLLSIKLTYKLNLIHFLYIFCLFSFLEENIIENEKYAYFEISRK